MIKIIKKIIEQKGMTFDHDLFLSPFFFLPEKKVGRRKGEGIAKIAIKSHAFLLDQKMTKLFLNFICQSLYKNLAHIIPENCYRKQKPSQGFFAKQKLFAFSTICLL